MSTEHIHTLARRRRRSRWSAHFDRKQFRRVGPVLRLQRGGVDTICQGAKSGARLLREVGSGTITLSRSTVPKRTRDQILKRTLRTSRSFLSPLARFLLHSTRITRYEYSMIPMQCDRTKLTTDIPTDRKQDEANV